MIKKIVLGLAVIFIVIQFIPVKKENPPVTADFKSPAEVKEIFKRACYNCHSNETDWPWYSNVAPVSWLVASDVEEAREHLNFSDWGHLTRKKVAKKKEDIWEEVEDDDMPLWQYKLMHPEAKLSKKDKQIIKEWAGE